MSVCPADGSQGQQWCNYCPRGPRNAGGRRQGTHAQHAEIFSLQASYRPWKVLKFLLFRIPCLESPGKRHRSWKTMEIPGKTWIIRLLEILLAFPLLYFNADTPITDFVYALFDLVQPMFWMEYFLEKGLFSPGKPWNWVFASPGKKHLNVCMSLVTKNNAYLFLLLFFSLEKC